jgi:hypothetical protein
MRTYVLSQVIFANAKYGNYKLKRNSDERELYWFKSDELWGEDERQAKINQVKREQDGREKKKNKMA